MSESTRPGSALEPSQRAGLVWPFLAAAVALPYLWSLGNGFAWLDHQEILAGSLIVHDIGEFLTLFSDDRNAVGYHRPMYNLMHSVDWAVWGKEAFGYHLSSLLLHVANVLLAYALLRRIDWKAFPAGLAVLLWGLHPVNTAAVGLIHAKADLLVVFFMLVCVLLLLSESRRNRLVVASALVALAAALFSKETAFLLPVVLLPLGLRGRADPRARARWVPFLAGAGILVIGLLALRFLGADGAPYRSPMGLIERLGTFAGVYVDYLQRLVVPTGLFVGDTVTRFSALPLSSKVTQLALAGGLFGLGAWLSWKLPSLRVWFVLFHVALLPVAQIVPVLHFRADRFLYLPSLFFCAFLVEGLRCMASHVGPAWGRLFQPRVVGAAAALVLVAFSWLIVRRCADFQDDVTLFRAETRKVRDYKEGLCALAVHLDRLKAYPQAGFFYERCLEESPGRISYLATDLFVVNYSFNLLAQNKGRRAYEFLSAHVDQPMRPVARVQTRYNLAVAAYKLKKYEEAVPLLEEYARLDPAHASCRYLLGVSAMRSGRPALSRSAFHEYLRLRPDAPDRKTVEKALARLNR